MRSLIVINATLHLGDYMKYACGMVCEYLPKGLASELEESYR